MPTASPIIRPSTGVMEFIGTSTLKASEPATPKPTPTSAVSSGRPAAMSEPRARTRTIAATGDIALFQFQFDDQLTSLPAGTTEAVVDAAMNADGVEQITVLPTNSLNDVLA